MEKKLIIFTDIGDTIVDENTQVFDDRHIVVQADCIPGAVETLRYLYDAGYRICMVADGKTESFLNILTYNDIRDYFSSMTISEEVGETKPSSKMFLDAMKKNGLTVEDAGRIVMVGNNDERDIPGAKRLGITSILIDWSDRHLSGTCGEDSVPDYRIHTPEELIPIVEKMERDLNGPANTNKK